MHNVAGASRACADNHILTMPSYGCRDIQYQWEMLTTLVEWSKKNLVVFDVLQNAILLKASLMNLMYKHP